MTRLLIVDDDQSTLASLSRAFRMAGYEAVVCDNAARAITLLKSERFDLVFSDVVMPGISGIDLARQIATQWPDLEVVLTSGYSHVLAEEGSFGFELLKKPYSIDGLLKALRQDRPM